MLFACGDEGAAEGSGLGVAAGRRGVGGGGDAGALDGCGELRRSAAFTGISLRVRGHVTVSPTSSAVTGIGWLQHAQRT